MTVAAPVRAGTTPAPIRLVVPVVATATAGLALARRQPLSWDEAVTAAVAVRPVHAIAGTLHHSDAVLGAYYLLVHGWGSALVTLGLRPTEVWWRIPSAAAAVVTCVLVASCARRSAGPAAAVVAGSSLAVMPLFAFYTVDARPYTLAAAVTVLAWWCWTRPGGPRPLLLATVVATLLVLAAWLQLFTVLVWPAFLLVGGRTAVRRSAVTLTAAAAGVVPLLVVALGQRSEIAWVAPATVLNTGRVALHVGGGVAVVTAAAMLAGLLVAGGTLPRSSMSLAVLWWTFGPFTVLAALDVVKPVLVARYAVVALPIAAVAFGVAVTRASTGRFPGATRTTALLVVIVAAATSAWQDTRPWKYEDYRGAATYAAHAVAAGTPVLFAPSSSRLGVAPYRATRQLNDVALPHGVGADPLAIVETGPTALRRQLAAACTVVVIGNALTVGTSTGPDAAELGTVAGWTRTGFRSFGQVTVTVVHDPACDTTTPPRG